MPVELFLSPIMRPIVKAQSVLMNVHREDSVFSPTVVPLGDDLECYNVRKEFGTGSKVFSVFDNADKSVKTYDKRLFYMVRSRAVKGSYKMYASGDEKPVAALRAGLRSNVLLMKSSDGSELELGWHVIDHKVDALDHYRVFQLSDGAVYHWTVKGHYLERISNIGQKEGEVRERIAQVTVYPNRKGFDLKFRKNSPNIEMIISTALVCYIEAWNTWRGYGGIYLAEQPEPSVSWKRD